jgi:adenylate kinase
VIYNAYGSGMAETTTVRIDRCTHEELKRLARDRQTTVAKTMARAVRLLHQEQMGHHLAQPLDDTDRQWLDAELG